MFNGQLLHRYWNSNGVKEIFRFEVVELLRDAGERRE
jgi:hypothetical protein